MNNEIATFGWKEIIYLGNSALHWVAALLITAIIFLALRQLEKWAAHRIEILTRRYHMRAKIVLEVLNQTKWFFLLAVAFWFGSLVLSISPKISSIINHTVLIVVIFQGAIWLNQMVTSFSNHFGMALVSEGALSSTALNFTRVLARSFIWIVAFLLLLDNLNFRIAPLITGLGIGGIAIAFAVQNILADIFASFSIIMDKPFVVGDVIKVDDLQGTVEHIGIKTTRLRSLTGEQIVFANNDLLKTRIRNYKRMSQRRIDLHLNIAYQTPYEKLEKIPKMLKEIVETEPNAQFERSHLKEFGEYAVVFEVIYHVLSREYNDYMDLQQSINFKILKQFDEEKINFAYPTYISLSGH